MNQKIVYTIPFVMLSLLAIHVPVLCSEKESDQLSGVIALRQRASSTEEALTASKKVLTTNFKLRPQFHDFSTPTTGDRTRLKTSSSTDFEGY